jgi:FkbM family methyltransferase
MLRPASALDDLNLVWLPVTQSRLTQWGAKLLSDLAGRMQGAAPGGSPARVDPSREDRGGAVPATVEDIDWCYRLLLGREPEPHGREGFVSLVSNGGTRDELVGYFVASPEFRERLLRAFSWREGAPEAVKVGSLTYYVSSGDGAIGASLRRNGSYEPAVTAMVRRHLKPGQRFVDVGASFGYFATLAGSIVGPEGSVIAIEPGPQNQSLLLLNLAVNGVAVPEVHQLALGDRAGLFMYSQSGANGFISPFSGQPEDLANHALVRAATLDSVVGERQVDMMKIDVEGAEGLVLSGASGTLARSHPLLLMEFSPPSLVNTSHIEGPELLKDLERQGYSFGVVGDEQGNLNAQTPDEVMRAFHATSNDHIDIVAWRP